MTQLSVRQIVAAVTEHLEEAGYARGKDMFAELGGPASLRLFEDALGVVAVAVFESWSTLVSDWKEVQAHVVGHISTRVGKSEPKAWEGYLLLMTPDIPPPETEMAARRIEYETSLMRKFVIAGDHLGTTKDVARFLAPLLPIPEHIDDRRMGASLLERIPQILREEGIQPKVSRAVVDAYLNQESIPQRIYDELEKDENP